MIRHYYGIAPKIDLLLLQQLCDRLRNRRFLHVISEREDPGVVEILRQMNHMLRDFCVEVRCEVLHADAEFHDIAKKMRISLEGNYEHLTKEMWEHYYEINRKNAAHMDLEADAVMIHDPQPVPLVEFRKTGTWIWRCHIDVSNPHRETWDFLRRYGEKYDSAIFSVSQFARAMPMSEFIVPPSIDPLSEKNRDLSQEEIQETINKYNIPADRPILLQVSRFARFKDPIGVIKAYRMVKKYNDCVLILAGSPAWDDPDGEAVLQEVKQHAADDPDIILLLPPFDDRDINAFQRLAAVVLQKSLKEGFGVTVSEAMWKGKPVIGRAVGGIPHQIVHGLTGFLVHSVEGTAFRIRQFLNNPDMARRIGDRAREFVRNNFLITRQIRDYLSIWYSLEHNGRRMLEL